MRKQLIYLIFFLFGINMYGQYGNMEIIDSTAYFHVINLDTFPGTIPEINNITGLASQFKTIYYSQELILRQKNEKLFRHYENTQKELSGEYISGKKIGKWEKIIHEGSCVFSEYTVYKTDTVIYIPDLLGNKEFYYIGDSSIVYGKINKHGYSEIAIGLTIEFKCKKSTGCIYKTPDQKVITRSDFNDLEIELWKIEQGFYNRKIKELIN